VGGTGLRPSVSGVPLETCEEILFFCDTCDDKAHPTLNPMGRRIEPATGAAPIQNLIALRGVSCDTVSRPETKIT